MRFTPIVVSQTCSYSECGREQESGLAYEKNTESKKAHAPCKRHVTPKLGRVHNFLCPEALNPGRLHRCTTAHRRVQESRLRRPIPISTRCLCFWQKHTYRYEPPLLVMIWVDGKCGRYVVVDSWRQNPLRFPTSAHR